MNCKSTIQRYRPHLLSLVDILLERVERGHDVGEGGVLAQNRDNVNMTIAVLNCSIITHPHLYPGWVAVPAGLQGAWHEAGGAAGRHLVAEVRQHRGQHCRQHPGQRGRCEYLRTNSRRSIGSTVSQYLPWGQRQNPLSIVSK